MHFFKKTRTISLCLFACVYLCVFVCTHSYIVMHLQLHWNPQIGIRSDANCILKWKASSGIINCQENICSKEISDDEIRTRCLNTFVVNIRSKKWGKKDKWERKCNWLLSKSVNLRKHLKNQLLVKIQQTEIQLKPWSIAVSDSISSRCVSHRWTFCVNPLPHKRPGHAGSLLGLCIKTAHLPGIWQMKSRVREKAWSVERWQITTFPFEKLKWLLKVY